MKQFLASLGLSRTVKGDEAVRKGVAMFVGAIYKPGQKGTKKLVNEYGEKLVAVRYRYDAQARKRYKTIELIVDEKSWQPKASHVIADDEAWQQAKKLKVRIDYDEMDLRNKAKSAGGIWSPDDKLWQLPENVVDELGLRARVVD